MTPKTLKRILIVISVILTVVVLVFIVYIFLINNKESSNIKVISEEKKEQEDNSKKAVVLIDDEIIDYDISPSNAITYYKKSNGNTYSTNTQGGTNELVSDFEIKNLLKVEWAPTATFVLTNINSKYNLYNYVTKKSLSLPEGVLQAGILADNSIYYLIQNPVGLYDLIVDSKDLDNKNNIIMLQMDKVLLQGIPLTTNISQVMSPPSAFRESPLRIIDTKQEITTSLLDAKYGLNVSWSPTGELGIITYSSDKAGKQMQMSLIDNLGKEQMVFKSLGTLAEKIVWSKDGKNIYFTKPIISDNRIMPDDYYDNSLGRFSEGLYHIDLTTFQLNELSANIGSVDSRSLQLNESGKELFFINRRDNKLYKYSL